MTNRGVAVAVLGAHLHFSVGAATDIHRAAIRAVVEIKRLCMIERYDGGEALGRR